MSKNINMHVGDITTLIVSEVVGKEGFLLVFICVSNKKTRPTFLSRQINGSLSWIPL